MKTKPKPLLSYNQYQKLSTIYNKLSEFKISMYELSNVKYNKMHLEYDIEYKQPNISICSVEPEYKTFYYTNNIFEIFKYIDNLQLIIHEHTGHNVFISPDIIPQNLLILNDLNNVINTVNNYYKDFNIRKSQYM